MSERRDQLVPSRPGPRQKPLEPTLYASFADMLQARVHELEQRAAILEERVLGLLDGDMTVCAMPGCGNTLNDRLRLGYATCSQLCTMRLQHLLADPGQKSSPHVLPPAAHLPGRPRRRP